MELFKQVEGFPSKQRLLNFFDYFFTHPRPPSLLCHQQISLKLTNGQEIQVMPIINLLIDSSSKLLAYCLERNCLIPFDLSQISDYKPISKVYTYNDALKSNIKEKLFLFFNQLHVFEEKLHRIVLKIPKNFTVQIPENCLLRKFSIKQTPHEDWIWGAQICLNDPLIQWIQKKQALGEIELLSPQFIHS